MVKEQSHSKEKAIIHQLNVKLNEQRQRARDIEAEIAELEPDVRDHDPLLALDGGSDGLDCYRAIAGGAAAHLRPEGVVLVEIGAGQADDVVGIFTHAGFRLAGKRADLGGHVRALAFGR